MNTYHKTRHNPPLGFFPCEAAGLVWLGEAQAAGGPRVAKVVSVNESSLDIEYIQSVSPTRQAAYTFGYQLAKMHDAGAQFFGSGPGDYTGKCYFGPLQDPVPMATGKWANVIDYLADGRLRPMVQLGIRRGTLSRSDREMTELVIDKLPELLGDASHDTPARVHGDLWSGNLLWSLDETGSVQGTLIDPAAHGGHREEDLAMLDLFGVSYESEILAGYRAAHPLASGFNSRIALWQLYPIAGHCVFFGGGYVSQYRSMCRSLLAR
jgi:fructosamine-3-kinase